MSSNFKDQDSLALEDSTKVCPETSENYPSTPFNIPKERISQLHSGGSLKSRG